MSKNYKKYLSSKHWKSRRADIVEKTSTTKGGDKRCHICLLPSSLQIHHLTYDRMNGEEDKDLVALCGHCHRVFHSYAKHYGIMYHEKKNNRVLLHALRKTREIENGKAAQSFSKEERKSKVFSTLLNQGIRPKNLNLTKTIKRHAGIETVFYQ